MVKRAADWSARPRLTWVRAGTGGGRCNGAMTFPASAPALADATYDGVEVIELDLRRLPAPAAALTQVKRGRPGYPPRA